MFQVTANNARVLSYRLLKAVENVDASFGGRFGPGDPATDWTQPPCQPGSVPAWAR